MAPDSDRSNFIVEIDPTVPERIFADPGRVQEVLINLASNALKYAPGNISLGVKLRNLHLPTMGSWSFTSAIRAPAFPAMRSG